MSTANVITLVISILGASLGLLSFYLTQIRKPKLIAVMEQRIRMGYTSEGGLQFYIPLTIINSTHQTGIVFKMNLFLYSAEKRKPIYSIDLARFCEVNHDKNQLIDKELPHAVAVNGKSSVYKLLRFAWWNNTRPQIIIDEQAYFLEMNLWTKDQETPNLKLRHKLILSDKSLAELKQMRKAQKNVLIEVPLDGIAPNNRVLG